MVGGHVSGYDAREAGGRPLRAKLQATPLDRGVAPWCMATGRRRSNTALGSAQCESSLASGPAPFPP